VFGDFVDVDIRASSTILLVALVGSILMNVALTPLLTKVPLPI